jgi:AraC-like DNA-binding protein
MRTVYQRGAGERWPTIGRSGHCGTRDVGVDFRQGLVGVGAVAGMESSMRGPLRATDVPSSPPSERPSAPPPRAGCGLEGPTVSIVLVRILVDAVERAGVDRDLLIGGRHDRDWLADGSVRVGMADYDALQARAIELTRDEALGLHIAEQASEGSFDLLAPLVSHAPTLREGVALCARFGRLLTDEFGVILRERGDVATIRPDFVRRSALSDRLRAEFAVGGFFRMIRVLGGPRASVLSVCFEHPRPAHHREYTRIFGGAERFGQAFTGVSFPRTLLDRPQIHSHGELSAVLRLEAERSMRRLSPDLDEAERLRQYLLVQRPSSLPDMKTSARDMGVSPRSMRRKLARRGVSYREIVQSVRETVASRMLADPNRTIQEVAHALGFSDSSAFHRAFKRWKGATPGNFQRVRDL